MGTGKSWGPRLSRPLPSFVVAARGCALGQAGLGPWLSRRMPGGSARLVPLSTLAMAPSKQEILAASSGWVAVVLNVVPGLGTGYLYQRRWRAYWLTSALATSWFVAGALLGGPADGELGQRDQLVGLAGLLLLAAITAAEAGLAARRARSDEDG